MATQPSLFGFSPEQVMDARDAQAQEAAMAYGKNPMQAARAGMFMAGNAFGGGIGGAMGGMDPEVAKAQTLRALVSQYDTTTPEGLAQFAQAVRKVDPNIALQAAQKAQAMSAEKMDADYKASRIKKEEAAAEKADWAAQMEEKLREELQALPPNASDRDVEAIVRKYGKPDAILGIVAKRQEAQAARAAREALEKEKMEERARRDQESREFRMTMAQLAAQQRAASTDLQRQMLQLKIDELKGKQSDKAAAAETKKEGAIAHANHMVTSVQEALNKVTGMNTGTPGKVQAIVPGSEAYDLNQRLLTLKANLGFDRLQQMREASPTGGALGQVAVQELQALQATVGSLEIGQSKEELEKNLKKVDTHYRRWLAAVKGEKMPTETPPAPKTTSQQQGWGIRKKD